jgi:HAD superfamily hydrolase (TIGR01490 family)
VNQARRKLTFFDLDHTLLPIDSDHAWGVFTTRIGWTDEASFHARNETFYTHYQAGTLDIREYVRFATEAIRRQGADRAGLAHAQFMREVIEPALRPAARQLVHAHQQAGDTVVIVTATNEFVTRPISQALGVSELIAVELDRDASGHLTGEIRGIPSFREGKVMRVDAWMAEHGLRWESCRDHLLHRLHERSPFARARGPPGGHQP